MKEIQMYILLLKILFERISIFIVYFNTYHIDILLFIRRVLTEMIMVHDTSVKRLSVYWR